MSQKIATILFFLTLIFISFPLSSQAYCEDGSESSIEQYGITWTFDGEYQCGQFVNGDYWVVDEGSGVNVVSVYPRMAIANKSDLELNPSGYLWYDNISEYWCISSLKGSCSGYNWRKYDSNPEGLYEWYIDDLHKVDRPDRAVEIGNATRTFSNAQQNGYYDNNDFFMAAGSSLREYDHGPYVISGEEYNGKQVYELGRILHGSMLNPGVGTQSYDSKTSSFDLAGAVEFPFLIGADKSLVSSISQIKAECDMGIQGPGAYDWTGACDPFYSGRPMIKTATVLTIVNSAPESGTFRPAFNGNIKNYYREADINSDLIKNLTPTPNAPQNIAYYERGLQRPWLMHLSDAVARSMHPRLNMFDYHETIFSFLKDAYLLTLLDIPDKNNLINLLIQNGIDTYGLVTNGWGSSAVSKNQVLFACSLLGDINMCNIYLDGTSKTSFREDWMTYYPQEGTSNLLSSVVAGNDVKPFKVGWTGEGVLWRQDPGSASEQEHLHPSEWSRLQTEAGYIGGGCKHESYRNINSANWPGIAMVALSLGGREKWNHDVYFDYTDRWMLENFFGEHSAEMLEYCNSTGGTYQSAGSAFATEMWHAYRKNFGCVYTDFDSITDSRIYECAGLTFSCNDISDCSDYPNQMALEYDACSLSCEETIPPANPSGLTIY
ncbi:MAG: hypothetical protein RBR14_08715 [Candidatus Cloacimonas acidaminovorans]|nr:hypothetical protein [Candidatus Cloacimonas acidaminovorans]